ncbi:MAG: phosphotransferase, partial [Acidobacteriota bacterium]|nr:phosphotransferase [Acidobacteriota bacterium]
YASSSERRESRFGKSMNEIGEIYLKRIREAFPNLEIKTIRNNSDGLTNGVFIVNEDLVFRFPKNETWALELLANEIKVIKLLRNLVEIPLPQIELAAEDLSVHRFIRGKPLCRHDVLKLNEKEKTKIAEQLSVFLKQMHNVPMKEVKRHGIGNSDTNRSREVWLKLYENAQKELFPLMLPDVREMTDAHFASIVADESFMNHKACLMNGDFVPPHILYDETKRKVVGIIDFGTAGTGDAAGDFACVVYNYGESFLKRMTRVYPEIRENIDRARFWAGTLELQWALSGVRTKNVWWHLVSMSGASDAQPIGTGF